jgi:hypothetical protein
MNKLVLSMLISIGFTTGYVPSSRAAAAYNKAENHTEMLLDGIDYFVHYKDKDPYKEKVSDKEPSFNTLKDYIEQRKKSKDTEEDIYTSLEEDLLELLGRSYRATPYLNALHELVYGYPDFVKS